MLVVVLFRPYILSVCLNVSKWFFFWMSSVIHYWRNGLFLWACSHDVFLFPKSHLSSPLGFPAGTHQYLFHYLPVPICLLLSPSRISNFLLVTSLSLFLPKFLNSPNFANSRCWFPKLNEIEGWILGVAYYNRWGKMFTLLEFCRRKKLMYLNWRAWHKGNLPRKHMQKLRGWEWKTVIGKYINVIDWKP